VNAIDNLNLFLNIRESAQLSDQIVDPRERVFVEMLCHRAIFCGDKAEGASVKLPCSPLDMSYLVTLGRDMYRLRSLMLSALLGDPSDVNPYAFGDPEDPELAARYRTSRTQ
jgi:hypothetical protein